jgi:predicted PurR-regulated permease PerM
MQSAAFRARLIIAALIIGVAWACLPFISGLLGALVLAVIARPAHRRLAPRIGERRSALVLTLVAALLLIGPGVLLVAGVVEQGPPALRSVVESQGFARLAALQVGDVNVGEQAVGATRAIVAWISSRAVAAAGSITEAIVNALLALLGMYYLLPAAPDAWRRARSFIPFSARGTDELAARFSSITEATLLGILATAVSQGFTVGVAFWAVSLPSPVFWGTITALVSVLPILGSALVWVPGVAVLVLDQRPGAAVALAAVGVVICSNVDNVIRPLIFKRVSGLHPMASLLGAFAGTKMLGLLGLLLGPLALAYCIELLHLYRAEYEEGALGTPSP